MKLYLRVKVDCQLGSFLIPNEQGLLKVGLGHLLHFARPLLVNFNLIATRKTDMPS